MKRLSTHCSRCWADTTSAKMIRELCASCAAKKGPEPTRHCLHCKKPITGTKVSGLFHPWCAKKLARQGI